MIIYILTSYEYNGHPVVCGVTKNLKEANKWLDESEFNDYYKFTV